MNRFLLFAALFYSTLDAGIENYFKKIGEKSDSHGMRNIDFIYLINLDQRPEKLRRCLDQLTPYNITPYRFSAVNGWELTLETINEVGVNLKKGMQVGHWGTYYPFENSGQAIHEVVGTLGQTYFCHCMSRGAIGIVLSHLSILQDAYDSGYETIWVMEDDIEVLQSPHLLSDMIDNLDRLVGKTGWDILFTDQDTKNNDGEYVPCLGFAWRPNFNPQNPKSFYLRQDINSDFRKIGARYGAYSMILRRSGMKKILDFIKTYHIFLPYDMDFYLPPKMRIFTVREDIISTQMNAPSDNGGANYKQ